MPWAKQFDEAETLESAMRVFWARGFAATSMSDLVEELGINRASIYATYGDKRSLFMQALKRYDVQHRELWFASLAAKHGPRGAIVEVFRAMAAHSTGGPGDGCFLVNTALELAPHDEGVRELVAQSLRSAELFFSTMLEADARDTSLAPVLLALLLGARVISRCPPGAQTLATVVAQVERLLP